MSILWVSMFLWPLSSAAAGETDAQEPRRADSAEWLDLLIAEQDWTGLRTEALRLAFNTPDGADSYRWFQAYADLRSGEPLAAADRFAALATSASNGRLAALSAIWAARSWRALDPEIARRRYQTLLGGEIDADLSREARLGLGWTQVQQARFEEARVTLGPGPWDSVLDEPRWRRPGVAGLASAVVPGAGYLYAGAPQEAAAALLLVGGFAAGTGWLVHERKWGGVVATGLLGFGFWMGNIYGSADAAARHNRGVRKRASDAIEQVEVELRP